MSFSSLLVHILNHMFCDKKISLKYSIQTRITELQTTFQNKKNSIFSICFFNKVLLFNCKDMVKPYYVKRSVHRIIKKKERKKENIR